MFHICLEFDSNGFSRRNTSLVDSKSKNVHWWIAMKWEIKNWDVKSFLVESNRQREDVRRSNNDHDDAEENLSMSMDIRREIRQWNVDLVLDRPMTMNRETISTKLKEKGSLEKNRPRKSQPDEVKFVRDASNRREETNEFVSNRRKSDKSIDLNRTSTVVKRWIPIALTNQFERDEKCLRSSKFPLNFFAEPNENVCPDDRDQSNPTDQNRSDKFINEHCKHKGIWSNETKTKENRLSFHCRISSSNSSAMNEDVERVDRTLDATDVLTWQSSTCLTKLWGSSFTCVKS